MTAPNSTRLYYAVQRAALCRCSTTVGTAGLNDVSANGKYPGIFSSLIQSVGISTSLEYEKLYELGRLQVYSNIEGIPNVEITVERAIGVYLSDSSDQDNTYGSGTLWHMCGGTVTSASNKRFNLNMEVSSDHNEENIPKKFVQCTGLYLSNYTINFNMEGPTTETVTLVGSHLLWTSGVIPTGGSALHGMVPRIPNTAASSNRDSSKQQNVSNVMTREDYTAATGIELSGLRSLTFSVNMEREELLELGSKTPYFRTATYPIETSLEIEFLARERSGNPYGYSANIDETKVNNGCGVSHRLPSTTRIDAGNRSFSFGEMDWTGTTYSGGDAGGGNATITESYTGQNYYAVGTNTDWTTQKGSGSACGFTSTTASP